MVPEAGCVLGMVVNLASEPGPAALCTLALRLLLRVGSWASGVQDREGRKEPAASSLGGPRTFF